MTMQRFQASRSQRFESEIRWFITRIMPEVIAGFALVGAALIVPMMLLK